MPSLMEAMPVSENRKRPSPPLSGTCNDFNGCPTGSKLRRPESPRKRPRPRSSGLLSHESVKDLRSHRVFSPSSELSWDMVNQKLGFEFGFVESEETEAKQIGKGDLGFASEDRGFDNRIEVSKGIDVSIVKCERPSIGNGPEAGYDSKTKSIIRPCVRQKVFKAPGSISYKRLLPYLMNISETNSRIDRCPKLDKGLEEKECSAMEPVRCDDASKCVNKDRVSTECQNGNSNTVEKNAADCGFDVNKRNSNSSETVALPPSLTESDMCSSQPFVNGNIPKSDIDLSPQNLMSNNSDICIPIAMEDSVIVKDNVILMASEDNKLEDYLATGKTDDGLHSKLKNNVATGETDDGLFSKVLDEVIANTNFSYTANGSDLVKNDELGKHSEDTRQPVEVHPFEGHKQTETEYHEGRDDGDVVNQVDDLNEESNQMTPPDAEIFVRPEEGIEADAGDYVILNKDNYVNGKASIHQGIASFDYSTRHDINSKCRGVLKPRSRIKLFRSPGSFSYRRMLPFLMDIAKDNYDAVAASQPEKPPEKDLGQPAPLAPGNQEIPFDKSNAGFEENPEDVSVAKPLSIPTSGPTTDNENPISMVNDTEFQMLANAETEELLQVKEFVSESQRALEISPSILTSVESPQDESQPVSLLCSSNSKSNSEELATLKFNEAISEADRMKSVVANAPLSQHDSQVSSRIPAGGPKRGILKRNPRGCRGLCTCLNCASFRLHAERAFEFSRNQMEDTEELVLGLVDELSYLRNVLEQSADSVHDHHVNQVKEACKKASEAEELAKKRLSHMNYDLGVHCQIACTERPRVKFANHVEEHLIRKPEVNFLNDKVLKEERDIGQREPSHAGCFRQR